MGKVSEWFKQSNRIKHLGCGVLIGFGADSWHCAGYVGVGVAGALEFKDVQYGNKWDWIDFTLTFVGVIIGYTIKRFVL